MAASFEEGRELLRSLGRGEEEALSGFHRLWGPALVQYLESRFGRLGVSVEDVYQETLIKVWRAADAYVSSAGSPSTWVFAIARNTAIDHLRKDRGLRARLERGLFSFARGHEAFIRHRDAIECSQVSLSHFQRALVEEDLRTFPSYKEDRALEKTFDTSAGSIQVQRSRAYKKLGRPRLKRRDALAWLGREGEPAVAKLLGWRPGRERAGVSL